MRVFILFLLIFNHILYSQGYKDKGIGLVSLKVTKITYSELVKDSILIYKTKLCKDEIAKYIYDPFLKNSPNNQIKSLQDIIANSFIEFEYEREGIPFVDYCKDSLILKVIYGYGKKKNPLKGWIKFDGTKMDRLFWNKYLFKQTLHFPRYLKSKYSFFEKPYGKRVSIKLVPSEFTEFDYTMHPLKVDDQWMYVKLVTPEDVCEDPKDKSEYLVWIKFLNKNGRPLVWYYTRGC
jgi:hypothetical protein